MTNTHEPRLARVAAMVADPARSRMLAYLLSGEYASASECEGGNNFNSVLRGLSDGCQNCEFDLLRARLCCAT